MVSLADVNSLVMAQLKTDTKSSEIVTIPEPLRAFGTSPQDSAYAENATAWDHHRLLSLSSRPI